MKQEKLNQTINRREQAAITDAILQAIPEGVHYHNLVYVLADLLRTFTRRMAENEARSDEPGIHSAGS